MKKILLTVTLLLAFTALDAAPARGGLHTFTQADGRSFQGYLKGDAAFHWIESNGSVVLFNRVDNNYYKAKLNSSGKFVMSKEKVISKSEKSQLNFRAKSANKHSLDEVQAKALQKLQRESRQGSHPR